jgi:hypothetical protein
VENHFILGVHITERLKNAGQVQEVLTEFGGNIKTRLGLHETDGRHGSPNGLLLLEMVGGEARGEAVLARLAAIDGVYCKKMVFDHPAQA